MTSDPIFPFPGGCGGPNLDYARRQGAAYADRVVADLAANHGIKEPGWPTSMREDHSRHIKELRESIIELFVIEACDSW